MYSISQLNDMLVPELQDIAIEQNINNAKKLDKQELISKILDKQTIMTDKNNSDGEKPKRKRILKSDAADAPAQKETEEKAKLDKHKKIEPVADKKKPLKKREE